MGIERLVTLGITAGGSVVGATTGFVAKGHEGAIYGAVIGGSSALGLSFLLKAYVRNSLRSDDVSIRDYFTAEPVGDVESGDSSDAIHGIRVVDDVPLGSGRMPRRSKYTDTGKEFFVGNADPSRTRRNDRSGTGGGQGYQVGGWPSFGSVWQYIFGSHQRIENDNSGTGGGFGGSND